MTNRLTTDPNDTRLSHGRDDVPVEQAEVYLVLPKSDSSKFVRPVRTSYVHNYTDDGSSVQQALLKLSSPHLRGCGAVTIMSQEIAETYARDPKFYGATYCVGCKMHRPVSEFVWDGTDEVVGS